MSNSDAPTPKIKMEGVYKSFGKKHVLNGVDLHVNKGESLVIIGGSGTGKSVLLKSVLGIIMADKGSIQIDGEETRHLVGKDRERMMKNFGMLFQGGALFDSLHIWENIAFRVLREHKLSKAQARELAAEKLSQVGMSADVMDQYPAELSGGMQKRVALARAIASNPEIIFFDEPTTGLDPIMADVINDLIIKCSKDLNLTTMTITHDMASASKIGDRIAMIYEGKIIWDGPAKEIYHSKNSYVDQFVHGRAHGPITDDKE